MPTISSTFTAKAVVGYKGGIRHVYNSAVADGVDATKVRPTDWHADHVDTAVVDFTLQNTSAARSASAAVVSKTLTLKAGTYRVDALAWVSTMSSPANPGVLSLRKDSSRLTDTSTWVDMRPSADRQFHLFGWFTHTGGSTTIDCWFEWESGTTRFGLNGTTEERFGQKLMIERIGD